MTKREFIIEYTCLQFQVKKKSQVSAYLWRNKKAF